MALKGRLYNHSMIACWSCDIHVLPSSLESLSSFVPEDSKFSHLCSDFTGCKEQKPAI